MGNLCPSSVLRTILKFGNFPRGYISSNPAREIDDLEEESEGAKPWPRNRFGARWLMRRLQELARMAVLGRATGREYLIW